MTVAATSPGTTGREKARAERSRVGRAVGFLIVLIALVTASGSFLVLTGQTRIEPGPDVVRLTLLVNIALVLLLTVVVAAEAAQLWMARRRGRAASRLHSQIIALFSIIAALPAFAMAVLATLTLDRGLDRWFTDRIQEIIDTSRRVAQAYVEEHSRVLALDLLAIAGEFNRVKPDLDANREVIAAYLTNQARLRALSAVSIIRPDRSAVIEGDTATNITVPPPPEKVFVEAAKGTPALIAPGTTNLVGGVMRLAAYDDLYLYLARPLDPEVTRHVRLTEENAAEYLRLEQNRFGIQVAFAALFLGMALVVLLSAIWLGLGFADRLVAPIRRLIGAANEVSAGNLNVAVPVSRRAGDIGSLAETFNTMTAQLRSQRDELVDTARELDERRRFTEAVLSGVSAGVIGLDRKGLVTLANRSALAALGMDERELVGRSLANAVPALKPILERTRQAGRAPIRDQVQIARDGEQRTFDVQVTHERSEQVEGELVLTLDDITDLVGAQRRSAWADVARRIAHEIKNPLTPIQLSAERLRRRFASRIGEEDRKVFDQCTETIVRQVGDIRRMVDEFSAFARMPKAVMEPRDLREVVKEAIFLQEVGNPNIVFRTEIPEEPVIATIDTRLVTQAMTNIIKNATEAIGAVLPEGQAGGTITVRVLDGPRGPVIEVEDNGKGLPAQDRDLLLEPYMTTREKGTGLGLAIVRKVMEEHGGGIALLDAPAVRTGGRGALIRLSFPAPGLAPKAQTAA